MRQTLVLLLALILVSCGITEDDLNKVKAGMKRSQVVEILGEATRVSDGFTEMHWWSEDSTGAVQFMTVGEDRYESMEYAMFRYDSLTTKGEAVVLDVLHDNLSIKQPTNMFRLFLQYRVVIDRTTDKATSCGYVPIGFVDRLSGGAHVSGRVGM